jgi:hypothetical protein
LAKNGLNDIEQQAVQDTIRQIWYELYITMLMENQKLLFLGYSSVTNTPKQYDDD